MDSIYKFFLRIIFSYLERKWARNVHNFIPLQKELLERINTETRDVECQFDETKPKTYKDYLPYIERIRSGEENILRPGKPEYFVMTSGTSGQKKYIPSFKSQKTEGLVPTWEFTLFKKFPDDYLKPRLMLFNAKETKDVGSYIGYNSTTTMLHRINNSFIGRNILRRMSVSPYETFFITDDDDALYQHLIWALRDSDLWCIMGYFTNSVL